MLSVNLCNFVFYKLCVCGSVPAPSFVSSTPGVVPVVSSHEVGFTCKFDPSVTEELFYQIQWEIEGDSYLLITKQYCVTKNMTLCDLSSDDFSVALGINVCEH